MPFKTFVPGVLTSSDVNTFLMRQSVITCTSATRPAAPSEGMTIYETDTDATFIYSGSVWENFAALGSWKAYSPTILSLNAGTDWVLGNATVAGQFVKLGRLVVGNAQIVFGNTSVFGTKALGISVPINVKFTTTTNAVEGIARYQDISAGNPFVGTNSYHAATHIALFVHSVSATYALYEGVTATVPFTWASTDTISINFAYEATS